MIGQAEHAALAANLLEVAGIKNQQTTTLVATDVVLFVVSVVDGPMPQTKQQIEAIRGQAHGPAAIFLVRAKDQPDPDLRQLVVAEIKDLLTTNAQPGVARMPVLYDNDPNITLIIRGFLAAP